MEEHQLTSVYDYIDQQRQVDRVGDVSELTYNQLYANGRTTRNCELQQNIAYQPNTTSRTAEQKINENDRIMKSVKKMRLILIILVIVNIVMLLLVTTVAIVGSIGGIQSKPVSISGESTSTDIDSLQSQFSELATETRNNISQLPVRIDAVNRAITQLGALTHFNISQISTELDEINADLRILNQFAMLSQTNISQILVNFSALRGNVTSVETQIPDLRLQLYCGPGEWRQVAYLNMSDPTQQCPSAWREYNTGGVRACGRPDTNGGSCETTIYPTTVQYARVCGRVIGYQFGSPDGFNTNTIDQEYVDGVSITHGSPRNHIWSYAAGVSENSPSVATVNNCPCSSVSGSEPPTFVGANYYCESGNPSADVFLENFLYREDKLWDGLQCEDSCCTGVNSPPWFSTSVPNLTSDDIEVRICNSESTFNENTLVEIIDLYIQ